jgi:hypothetical protein
MAGEGIASLWTVVILGGKKPELVEFNSNKEEGSGLAVPIPIFCWESTEIETNRNNTGSSFFI